MQRSNLEPIWKVLLRYRDQPEQVGGGGSQRRRMALHDGTVARHGRRHQADPRPEQRPTLGRSVGVSRRRRRFGAVAAGRLQQPVVQRKR